MKYYLRGEIAKIAGINMETLRYYEKNKLIPIPNRTSKGYRLYSEDILTIIRFIKSAKSAGFSLEQIRNLFSVVNGANIDLNYIEELINEKLVEISNKIIELKSVEENLKDIKEHLYQPHECPLANAFNNNSGK
ncbi:MerR family transcriptional regulator [Clostridium sp. C8-1-8]|uniref:MerR family transcriptional regulator n=1 Tax=Clostridium sp. C8-1-8 TaxID=2698831 RepID=UPI0013696AD4|nr:MerR family transcriptional regulator [Clostridium sp. C8-1-8]